MAEKMTISGFIPSFFFQFPEISHDLPVLPETRGGIRFSLALLPGIGKQFIEVFENVQ